MKIYLKIKEHRQKKGLTQKELAELLNIDYQTISKYEIGANTPSLERAIEIAYVLGITIDELVDVDRYINEYHNELFKLYNGDKNE